MDHATIDQLIGQQAQQRPSADPFHFLVLRTMRLVIHQPDPETEPDSNKNIRKQSHAEQSGGVSKIDVITAGQIMP